MKFNKNNSKEYNTYLKKRSIFSYLYRNLFLYPTLQKKLTNPVLDVGCGIGDYLRFNKESIGADINQYNINELLASGYKAVLIENNILKFQDNYFNSVLLDNVLEHISEPLPLLMEVKRVLKKNGILLIGLPGTKGFKMDKDHKKNYSEISLKNLIEKEGFTHIKSIRMPLNLKLLSEIMSQYCTYTYFKKI